MDPTKRLMQYAKEKHFTNIKIAKDADVSPQAVTMWVNGERKMSVSKVKILAAKWGLREDWAFDGKEPQFIGQVDISNENIIFIKEYKAVSLGCGDACEPTYEELLDVEPVGIPENWLISKGADPKKCKIFRVSGDSMTPTLNDGDLVVIDTTWPIDRIIDNNIYALWDGSYLKIKRLVKDNLSQTLYIKSDNKDYPQVSISFQEASANNVQILGKAILRIGLDF